MQTVLVASVSVLLGTLFAGRWPLTINSRPDLDQVERFSCRPFLPPVGGISTLHADNPLLATAARQTSRFLNSRFSKKDMDSLSVAIVSADSVLFEENYGVMRGNESHSSPVTTSDSMYRIASVSKLFTVLEGHILAERGVISW